MKWFGARGDGITDDTVAIQKALVGGTSHQTLYFPTGTYKLAPELYLGIYKTLKGDGWQLTTLKFTMNAANGAALLLDQYCQISNLSIENNGTNATSSIGICSYTPTVSNGWANGRLSECKIIGFGHAIGASLITPAIPTLTRSQAFNTKIINNIFEDCHIPIQLGLGANAINIAGNWFVGTTGANNIWLGESYLPIIAPDNSFQGCASYDIHLLACWSAKVSGYFEPACGIYADSCPGLDVSNCVLVGQTFGGLTNNAFVRTNAATNTYGYPLPIKSKVSNVVLDGSAIGKYFVVNDVNAETLTDNLVNRQNDITINGSNSYPEFLESVFVPTLTAPTGAAGTYLRQVGWFQQRGKQISCSFAVGAAVGTLAGAVSISGFPKNASADSFYGSSVSISEANNATLAVGYTQVSGEITQGINKVLVTKISNTGLPTEAITAAELGANPFLVGSVTYEID